MSSLPERKRKLSDAAHASSSRVRPKVIDGAAGPSPPHPEADEDIETVHRRDRDPSGLWHHNAASDNARMHNGSNYIQNQYIGSVVEGFGSSKPSDLVDFVEALRFVHMDSRYDSIDQAHLDTCRRLCQKLEYLRWRNPGDFSAHHGFFWIKGKAGSGKSTLMKYAIQHAEEHYRSDKIISFFFNARGHDLEKSVEGLYRSLLSRLLVHFPDIRALFPASVPLEVEQGGWKVPTLKNHFGKAVTKLRQEQAVTIYIDALDECDEDEVREAIEHFEELGVLAAAKGIPLRICLASRYYPHITIQRCVSLALEDQDEHEQDICSYVFSKLAIQKPELRTRLVSQIQERSSGVFLWVVLVVRILKKEHDRGSSTSELLDSLRRVPDQLQDLMQNLLKSPDDALVSTIQWVLFARQPLTLEELYFAIRTSLGQLTTGVWDPTEIDLESMKSFVITSSRGLVEMTNGKQPTAQLVHESVREYLLAEGLAAMQPVISANVTAYSHATLSRWCQAYVCLDPEEHLAFRDKHEDPTSYYFPAVHLDLWRRFPFLRYAESQVFYHLWMSHNAEGLDVWSLLAFPWKLWMSLPCVLRSTVLIYKPASCLYLLLYWGYTDLVQAILEANAVPLPHGAHGKNHTNATIESAKLFWAELDLNEDCTNRVPRTLLRLAIMRHHTDIIWIFLDHGAKLDTLGSHDFDLVADAGAYGNEDTIQMLLQYVTRLGVKSYDSDLVSSALIAAATHKNFPNVQALMLSGADVNSVSGKSSLTPLSAALTPKDDRKSYSETTGRVMDVVQLLLRHGADVNLKVHKTSSPLEYAAKYWNREAVQMILDNALHVADQTIEASLVIASESLNIGTMRCLLERGLHADAVTTALVAALQILYDDPLFDLQNLARWDYSIFKDDVKVSRSLAVRMLLDAGADANATDRNGNRDLTTASSFGYIAIVNYLIDASADVNAAGAGGRTALISASSHGHVAIVKLLIDAGADIDAADENGYTSLFTASSYEHVKLLIDAGADVNAANGHRESALFKASYYGLVDIVKLLIDAGADIDAADKDGCKSLFAASARGQFDTLKLLVERGADLHHRNMKDRTALDVARLCNHSEIARSLENNMKVSTDPATVSPTESPQPQSSARPWLL